MSSAAEPQVPEVDYPHLPGEEHNPLMESTLHAAWCTMLIQAVRHTLAGTGAMVTGNTPFVPNDGGPHTAPDLMVVPGLGDRNFGRYTVGVDGPPPSACIEVTSPSNTPAVLERRLRRWLVAGVDEVYQLDPERETVDRVWIGADGTLVRQDARGTHSTAMNLSFAVVEGRLALCCPGGRAVRLDDDPYGWLQSEQRRADEAESRADEAESRADEAESRAHEASRRAADAEARAAELEAEVARLRDERERGRE
jgi:Uma2 family endonuclease